MKHADGYHTNLLHANTNFQSIRFHINVLKSELRACTRIPETFIFHVQTAAHRSKRKALDTPEHTHEFTVTTISTKVATSTNICSKISMQFLLFLVFVVLP